MNINLLFSDVAVELEFELRCLLVALEEMKAQEVEEDEVEGGIEVADVIGMTKYFHFFSISQIINIQF